MWQRRVHEIIASHRREIEELCRGLGVRQLAVFGSALGDTFDPASSDVDILVDFDTPADFEHFALKEGLEAIFGRTVDLVTSTSIRKPYFREQVARFQETRYAA
jgi:predicted nucleotidyltransferase